MHLASCRHPEIVYNSYLKENISVPCGNCPVCLTNRSLAWVSRLELERQHSAYTIFFTLTYAEEYLPLLELVEPADKYTPAIFRHKQRDFSKLKNKVHDEFNTYQLPVYDTILSEQATKNIMRLHAGCIPYCSVYDVENFVKRLRSKVYRKLYGTDKNLPETSSIRYYIASEFGPTSLRPHYHGLFFCDSKEVAETISDLFSQAWQFGRYDIQYVSSSAASYVAAYINSINNLPRIYKETLLRPKALQSRRCPIGLRPVEREAVEKVFFNQSPVLPCQSPVDGSVTFVPLWRSLEDRFFPKLPYDSTLSSDLRVRLLGTFTRLETDSFESFCNSLADVYCHAVEDSKSLYFVDYLETVFPFLSLYKYGTVSCHALFLESNAAKSIFYVSRRIQILMYRYNIDIVTFANWYRNYKSNKELYLLKMQYDYEENFVNDAPACFLLNLDNVYYNRLRSLTYESLTPLVILQLEGFGLSFSQIKEIFSDDKNKKSYFRKIYYSHTLDYRDMMSIRVKIVRDIRKTKRKNEYLEKHPEFLNLY